ncbi:MAG TPA: TIGR01210 family radical SAM protein [Methanomicrobia archaeon]|nr:TIGR01210 family radical SAM protein [Methanomicrobia archaeon]
MASWKNTERIGKMIGTAQSIVLPTRGCSYDQCYMCSYSRDCPSLTPETIVETFAESFDPSVDKVKIFTSGSFLDTKELTTDQVKRIADIVASSDVHELCVETRPEFVNEEALVQIKDHLGGISLEVAMGLESANDDVLTYYINKGFTYADYETASTLIHALDCRVKTYLLLKPPFMTEYEAMVDVVDSIRAIEKITDVISINPVSIHKYTPLEQLWRKRSYRPPYLWSLVSCLNEVRKIGPHVMSHPVAVGRERGIHNCGSCEQEIMKQVETYNLHGSAIDVSCPCKNEWERELTKIFS